MKIKAFVATLTSAISILASVPALVHADILQPKIAIAYDIGFLGDNSFNDAVNAALSNAKKRYGLVEPFVREVPTNGTAVDRLNRLRFLAQNGYTLIIAVGAGYRDTIKRVSMEYPDTQFAIINDKALAQMNISNIYFLEDQGAYVAGLIAALSSKRKSIGFIGSDAELLASYTKGARIVSRKIKVVNIDFPDSVGNLKKGLSQVDIAYSTWDGDATVISTILESYAKKVKLIVERPDQYFADLMATRSVILATINKNLERPINQLVAAALENRSIIDILNEEQGIYGREYGLKNKGIEFTLANNSNTIRSRINAEIKRYLTK